MAIIVLGNRDAGDDAAGPLVGEALRAAGVEVLAPADALELAEILAGAPAAVIVDAATGPGPAGTVHRLDRASGVLPAPRASSHGLGLAEALALAEALGGAPELAVYAIVGRRFDPGAAVDPAVRAAVAAVVEEIRRCA